MGEGGAAQRPVFGPKKTDARSAAKTTSYTYIFSYTVGIRHRKMNILCGIICGMEKYIYLLIPVTISTGNIKTQYLHHMSRPDPQILYVLYSTVQQTVCVRRMSLKRLLFMLFIRKIRNTYIQVTYFVSCSGRNLLCILNIYKNRKQE